MEPKETPANPQSPQTDSTNDSTAADDNQEDYVVDIGEIGNFDPDDGMEAVEDEEGEEEEEEEGDGITISAERTEAIATAIAETGLPSPPDGGWGWVIVAASFMCFLVMDGITSTFGVLLPQIVETFQKDNPSIGRSDVAWAGSLLSGVSLCIGPIVSALTNKYGCRFTCMTGSIIASLGFLGAAYAPTLSLLLLTYGLIGGIGMGFLYLPAIVCVGYYFESKRALATGISLAGSGIGAMTFAPVIIALGDFADWRTVCFGLSGLAMLLVISGALMRPLEIKVERLAISQISLEKATPTHRSSGVDKKLVDKAPGDGSDFFVVQLPDGSLEQRPKKTLNIDPTAQPALYLDQLSFTPLDDAGGPISNVENLQGVKEIKRNNSVNAPLQDKSDLTEETVLIAKRPSRTLQKQISHIDYIQNNDKTQSSLPIKNRLDNSSSQRRQRRHSAGEDDVSSLPATVKAGLPSQNGGIGDKTRKTSVPVPVRPNRQLRRAGSTTSKISEPLYCFENMQSASSKGDIGAASKERKYSMRLVPSATSFGARKSSFESGNFKSSASTIKDSRRDVFDDDYKFLLSTRESGGGSMQRKTSLDTTHASSESVASKLIVRPMSRKDIFYLGSIHNLPEYQSNDIDGYHQSIVNIAKKIDDEEAAAEPSKPRVCPCCPRPSSAFRLTLAQMMDFKLLKNPVFLTIAMSAVFGMLGFFVPMVYVIDYALKQGIKAEDAAWFISIIGVTSTIGRVIFGMLSDLPWVNALTLYNFCVLAMGISTFVLPFCFNYYLVAFVYTCYGTGLSGFIALSSIILVELLGLENLTSAFGLLIFFRGISTVLGTPLSGAIFDATQSYDIPFFSAGAFLIISSLISFMIPYVARFSPPKPILEAKKLPLGPLEDILEECTENGSGFSGSEHVLSEVVQNGVEKKKDKDCEITINNTSQI